jgi:hypothetical protein
VTGLFNTENTLDPSNNFVRGRVSRLKTKISMDVQGKTEYISNLVEINNTIADVFVKRTLQRRTTAGNGSVMASTNIQLIVILNYIIKSKESIRGS